MNCAYSAPLPLQSQDNIITNLIRWCKSLSIKPQHKALLRSLIDYHGKDGRCYPSVRRLAGELCVTPMTIHRWLNVLEKEGIIARNHRYRENGGQTSNAYRLLYKGITKVLYKKRVTKNKTHAAKQDVVCKDKKVVRVKHTETRVRAEEGLEPPQQEECGTSTTVHQISNLAPSQRIRYNAKSSSNRGRTCPNRSSVGDEGLEPARNTYRINVERMTSLAECLRHYAIAIQQKWIDSGSRSKLSYFSSWAKCVRLYREERLTNPAAMMVHVIKNQLLNKYPANCDEEKAIKILRELRAEESRAYLRQ